jgi:hypothetical protein
MLGQQPLIAVPAVHLAQDERINGGPLVAGDSSSKPQSPVGAITGRSDCCTFRPTHVDAGLHREQRTTR